jgi:hypothetical protein
MRDGRTQSRVRGLRGQPARGADDVPPVPRPSGLSLPFLPLPVRPSAPPPHLLGAEGLLRAVAPQQVLEGRQLRGQHPQPRREVEGTAEGHAARGRKARAHPHAAAAPQQPRRHLCLVASQRRQRSGGGGAAHRCGRAVGFRNRVEDTAPQPAQPSRAALRTPDAPFPASRPFHPCGSNPTQVHPTGTAAAPRPPAAARARGRSRRRARRPAPAAAPPVRGRAAGETSPGPRAAQRSWRPRWEEG